jgi:hypothetical protein
MNFNFKVEIKEKEYEELKSNSTYVKYNNIIFLFY